MEPQREERSTPDPRSGGDGSGPPGAGCDPEPVEDGPERDDAGAGEWRSL